MRIVIDMQAVQTGSSKRGIGRYTKGLVKGILSIRKHHEIILSFSSSETDESDRFCREISSIIGNDNIVHWSGVGPNSWDDPSNRWRRMASDTVQDAFYRSLNPDILLFTSLFEGYSDNFSSGIKRVPSSPPVAAIFYDLIPLSFPDQYISTKSIHDWYYHNIEVAKNVDLMLSISSHTCEEAVRHLGINRDQVAPIFSGVGTEFSPSDSAPPHVLIDHSSLGIDKPFILTAGGAEPRKNVERLIEAFSKLPGFLQKEYQLVVLGCTTDQHKWQVGDLWCNANWLPREKVVPLGHVSDDQLISLYRSCSAFVFPSWFEGFGLPPLEAMACGAPVISSGETSLPEVIGREDILFDPYDVDAIAEKLELILTDNEFRSELRSWGPQRARLFTWERSADLAISAMEKLHTQATVAPKIRSQLLTEELVKQIADLPCEKASPSEGDLVELARAIAENEAEARRFSSAETLPSNLTWRIEGPFDSSYSLALLNREFAIALDELGHNVALHSTEGPGDFIPDSKFLSANPHLARMYEFSKSIPADATDVTSRNLYPPRVRDIRGTVALLHSYGWEETGFPQDWADSFSTYLDGVACMSGHVEKIMIDHGVNCPIEVSSLGVDHWERIDPDPAYRLKEGSAFRFLHVSSCFPRKGVEEMLLAFGREFTKEDDVSLIIKTFPNPHNEVLDLLDSFKRNNHNFPSVIIIQDDLSAGELKALYQQCDALVAPSKAEGFGLPLAEAMLSGLAVITTGWSGQLDFCNEKTAWLVDFEFEQAVSHFGVFSSAWARPCVDDLAAKMRKVFELDVSERKTRAELGREMLLQGFTWRQVAERTASFARDCGSRIEPRAAKVGWITTWNTRCGIATYSQHLINNISLDVSILAPENQEVSGTDGPEVHRCWHVGETNYFDRVLKKIKSLSLNTIVIQFNYGFFRFSEFSDFLNILNENGIIVVITLHSTVDPEGNSDWHSEKKIEILKSSLSKCERILVHSISDLNRLKRIGLLNNVSLFPHGIMNITTHDKSKSPNLWRNSDEFIIGSYGFFLPNKGISELVKSFNSINEKFKSRLILVNSEYPDPSSRKYINYVKKYISDNGLTDKVDMITDFLSDDQSISNLMQSDVIVFPYQKTGESSSAAVRYGLATGKPIAVTPLPIFDDVAPAVFSLPGLAADEIAGGLEDIRSQILRKDETYLRVMRQADRWRSQHLYSRLGPRLEGMLLALNRKCSQRP